MSHLFAILLRKAWSAATHLGQILATARVRIRHIGNPAVRLGTGCTFGQAVRLRTSDGGTVTLGRNVYLGDFVQVIARGGQIKIGDDGFIGQGCVLVAIERIDVGRDALIAEYTVIRDQDHDHTRRPVRQSGLKISPVVIGDDVWIGSKATILRGVTVGDRCIIGAHSLVRSSIPADNLAVGAPARIARRIS